jgi:hypothetical protein
MHELRRSRRARCAALMQCCRFHEWSWNGPSSFFYGARLPWPVVRGADVAAVLACATILLTS